MVNILLRVIERDDVQASYTMVKPQPFGTLKTDEKFRVKGHKNISKKLKFLPEGKLNIKTPISLVKKSKIIPRSGQKYLVLQPKVSGKAENQKRESFSKKFGTFITNKARIAPFYKLDPMKEVWEKIRENSKLIKNLYS